MKLLIACLVLAKKVKNINEKFVHGYAHITAVVVNVTKFEKKKLANK